MIISFTNVIGAIRSLGEAAQVITTNLKMWLGFETSETIGKNIYDGGITNPANGGTFTDNGNGTFTVTGDGTPNLGIGVRDFDADYLTVGGTYKFYAQGANTTVAVYDTAFNLLTSGINSVEFQATTSSIKLYISPTNGVSATYSDVEVRQLTQITPDKSGNNNVGELFTGKALEFDGVNDNVAFTFTTPVKSAVFWVKPLGTGLENILTFGGAFAGTKSIRSNSNVISSLGLSSVSVYVNGVQSSSVPLNQWSRVVVNFASVTPSELKFGFAFNSYGNIQLSDVQLYNENLSTDDIAYDYANPQNLVTDRDGTSIGLSNLKGYWHLSEGAGSLVYDSSGEGNNGTINGATYVPAQPRIPQLGMMNFSNGAVATGVTLIPDPNNTSQDIDGNAVRDRLNSLNLDGSGYAEVADDADLDFSGQLTLETWVKADFNNVGSIFNAIYSINGSIAAATGLGFYTDSTKVYYRIGGATNSFTYTQGKWYYLAIIRDSSNNFKFYKGDDGIISEVASGNNTVDFTSTESKFIGKDATNDFSRYYSNLVDDTRAYDRGLTLDEIENNYNAGLSAHTND